MKLPSSKTGEECGKSRCRKKGIKSSFKYLEFDSVVVIHL